MIEQAGKVGTIDPDGVPGPHASRIEPLPSQREVLDAEWLGQMLRHRYPGVEVRSLEQLQLFDSHTTKIRLKVDFNEAGRAAGLPSQLCLKTNWSGGFNNVDIHALEARFYYYLAQHLKVPVATCYYADWDHGGPAQGLIILEDLNQRDGYFGNSTQQPGVDGVAAALECLAKLHGSLWDHPLLQQHCWLQTSMNTSVNNDQIRIMWQFIEHNLAEEANRKLLPAALLQDPGERLRWVPWVIENAANQHDEIEQWRNRRKNVVNALLWYREEYLVVLGKRSDYWMLITAYCTSQRRRVEQLRRERDSFYRAAGRRGQKD